MSSEHGAGDWVAGYDRGLRGTYSRAPVIPSSAAELERSWFLSRIRALAEQQTADERRRKIELEAQRKRQDADNRACAARFTPAHPVARYMAFQPVRTPPSVLAAIRAELAEKPLQGLTAGELAVRELELEREHAAARQSETAQSGLVVDTELRETLGELEGYERRFTERSALLRAVQTMPQLAGHRVGICLRYMAEARRSKGVQPANRSDPLAELSADDRRGTVQVVGRRSRVAPELGGLEPMPSALPLQPRYRGVAVCGSGWVCPMCAARITEGRRKELERACSRHRDGGGLVLLLTQTFSHGRSDNLGDAWKALGRARQRFARSSAVKKFRELAGFVGRVACREVTYGLNGWHPHAHELVLVAGGMTQERCAEFEAELAREWQACCAAVGLSASLEHGLKLSLTEAASYVAKWGLDSELTKWQLKRGRVDAEAGGELALAGLSPFDLLRIYANEFPRDALRVLLPETRETMSSAPAEKMRARAAHLFAEYAEAVVGTAQLHWTRGLKKKLEVDELSDTELAERDESDEQLLGTLTAHEWFVLVHRRNQIEFLGLVAAQGWEAARVFLDVWVSDFDRYSAAVVRRRLRELRQRRELIGARFRHRGKKHANTMRGVPVGTRAR